MIVNFIKKFKKYPINGAKKRHIILSIKIKIVDILYPFRLLEITI